MEQIVKLDGIFYYGEQACDDADEVYRRFRDEYNAGVGRAAYKRLSRLGSRKERVHEFGFIFDMPKEVPVGAERKTVTLLGLVAGSYCWMLDGREIPGDTEEAVGDWIDIAFQKGSGLISKTGKTKGSGRKSKRLRTRYR